MRKLIGEFNDNFKKFYGSLRKKYGLCYEETLEAADIVFENKNNIDFPVILICNRDEYSEEFIKELNEQGEYQAFGFYHDGELSYNSVEDLKIMIPKLLKGDDRSKKFIYISVDWRSKFTFEIPGTICIKQGISREMLYLDIIKTNPIRQNEVIRRFREDDASSVSKMLNDLYKNRCKVRPDLFLNDFALSPNDVINLCRSVGNSDAVVCVRNGYMVGFMIYDYEIERGNRGRTEKRIIVIKDFYVREEFRRRGIATRMFEEVSRTLVKSKRSRVRFQIMSDDLMSRKFIASLHAKELYSVYEQEL